jgi:hypothetical protein
MIFHPDFLKMQIHFPDFLEYLHLPNDYCHTESCLIHLRTCCSINPLLYQFLKMGTTFFICFIFYEGMKRAQSDEQKSHLRNFGCIKAHNETDMSILFPVNFCRGWASFGARLYLIQLTARQIEL